MSAIELIQQGDSLTVTFKRPDDLPISGWICTLIVKQHPADTAAIERTITPTGNVWTTILTSTETSALAVGLWLAIGKLTNATTVEEAKPPVRFQVGVAWA